jgi:hypothetical protein
MQPVMTVYNNPKNSITFNISSSEMLRVAEDGFYIRGEKVPTDKDEGKAVYRAFKQWLVEQALTKEF